MSVDGLPVPDGEYLVDGDYILIENGWMWSTPDNDDPNEVWEYVWIKDRDVILRAILEQQQQA